MTSAEISLILFGLEQLIQREPQIEAAIRELFSKENITPADWELTRQRVLAKSYKDLVPNSGLPADELNS